MHTKAMATAVSRWHVRMVAVLCVAAIPVASARADLLTVDAASATIEGDPRAFALHLVDDDHDHRIALDLGSLGKVGLTSFETDAVTLPVFRGATGFSARVYLDGILQSTVGGRTKPLVLKGFGGSDSGGLDVIQVHLDFAAVRPKQWSVRITHGRRSVVLIPEWSTGAAPAGPTSIAVQTTGVDHFLIESYP